MPACVSNTPTHHAIVPYIRDACINSYTRRDAFSNTGSGRDDRSPASAPAAAPTPELTAPGGIGATPGPPGPAPPPAGVDGIDVDGPAAGAAGT
ncbi:hypothetical protein [Mycolicibacterium mageritense]|uniref:hypothetical protein n=1 Tax=Mycolicibacterium mageritense TaxID=53462 RepID=UPI001E44DEA0|nr:hypothetical protein [Mycolicibacterium mageritense]MCC9184347.1 hypothetical protein [Mycolicibacterium mageritense]